MGHIVIAGPVDTAEFGGRLHATAGLPVGRGGPSVTRLVLGLHDRGHRVTVVTTASELSSPHERVEAEGERLRIVYGPYRPHGRARDAFAVERAFFREVVGDLGADVVHAHWSYEEALGALRARPDTVVTVRDWGPTVLRHHPHPYRVVRLGMQLAVLRRARTLTAPSPYLAQRVQRWSRAEVDVVPNPIADEDVRDGPRPFPVGPMRLVAVNNGWGNRKNVQALLRALPLVHQHFPDAGLELIGTGYEAGGPAAQWAKHHELASGVAFRGRVDLHEVLATLEDAAVFVHPAREESFGNVLIEAMARGTPVVAGASSGAVPWVVGDTAELVDVEDPTAIAEAVLRLGRDGERWQERSAAGLQAVTDRFRTSAVAASYEALYERRVP